MRSLFSFILLLTCCLTMVACSREEHVNSEGFDTTAETSCTQDSVFEPDNVPEKQSVPVVVIKEERIQIGNSAVSYKLLKYPYIIFSEDDKLSERVNSLITEALSNHYKKVLPGAGSLIAYGAEIEYIVDKCEYYVSADNASISMAFYVDLSVYGSVAADETANKSFFALNIDLVSGSILPNTDIYKDLELLKDDILLGNLKPVADSASIDIDVVREALIQYRNDYSIYPEVFFSNGGIIISVETSRSHGDYLLFEIPSDTADKYFN